MLIPQARDVRVAVIVSLVEARVLGVLFDALAAWDTGVNSLHFLASHQVPSCQIHLVFSLLVENIEGILNLLHRQDALELTLINQRNLIQM